MSHTRMASAAGLAALLVLAGCNSEDRVGPLPAPDPPSLSQPLTSDPLPPPDGTVAAEIDPTSGESVFIPMGNGAPPAGALSLMGTQIGYSEFFNDPLSGWKSRFLGLYSNLQNYYVATDRCWSTPGGEDCRGNNLDGLWMHDGDGEDLNSYIRFSPEFAASLTSMSIDVGSHDSSAVLTIYDRDLNVLLEEPIPVGCSYCAYPPGSGNRNSYVRFAVGSSNGIGGFDVVGHHVEGNVGIDNVVVVSSGMAAPNQDPVADAGEDLLVACGPAEGGEVTLDGSASYDPDDDELAFQWLEGSVIIATGMTPTVTLLPGVHTITLVVSDGREGSASDELEVTVQADQPPVLTLLGASPLVVECHGSFVDPGWDVSDDCDPQPAVETQGFVDAQTPGRYTITYTATDQAGNATTAERVVEVVDTTAPAVHLALLATELWPPNHRMRCVARGISATDGCDGAPHLTVTVSHDEERSGGKGRGWRDRWPDYRVRDNGDGTFDVFVRAERDGRGDGRVYTITAVSVDASGHETSVVAEVTVPHDRGEHPRQKPAWWHRW